ncbi:uncharacterized protein LOC132714148 [Ruditapes philippinarum]|uniref:uncharacterized protein LOC132714148 n=1 Tax=Ruditapes philippinarum TaxID=129788 RepID=UPI00295A6686|nr:uncharacterized protein LOC132714148 [Ruditapes philippinarum]
MSVVQYYGRPGPGVSATYRMNYAVNSYFPSRKPRPSSLKGNKTLKKDIKETIQHATLINIVAAVNENLHRYTAPRQASGATARSTITVIPNVMIPHEKTVSIPQAKQRIFNMPDEIVQRKPVYYKHSADLEVRTNSHIRFYDEPVSFDLKGQRKGVVKKRVSSAKEFIKSLPNKPRTLDINFQDHLKNKRSENKHIQVQNEYKLRIASSVRRLGCVKKSAPREVYDLPKCDAIDIQDTKTGANDEERSVFDDSKSAIPPFTQTKIPYIRTKSLPVLFPTKTSNSLSATATSSLQKQPLIFKDRPLSQSLRKQTPDSMYTRINHLPGGFGYGGMTINNGINQAPDVSGKLIHDSEKQPHTKGSASSNARLRLTRTLRSPSSPTIGRRNGNVFTPIQSEFHSKQTNVRSYTSKHDLHEAVRSAINGQVERTKSCEARDDSKRILTSARSRKSCLTSKSGISDTLSGNQATKKVQFLSSDSSLDNSDTNSVKDEQSEYFDVRGGSSVLQAPTPTSVLRSFSPAIQPMSARELLRLEQKILPANTRPPPADNLQDYYATKTLLSVHTLLRNDSDISEKPFVCADNNTDNKIGVDIDKDLKHNVKETHDHDNDIDNDQYTSEDDSEFRVFTDSNDMEGEENENDTEGFYKLVKAFDKQPYEGFEHKKIRRASAGSKSKDIETDNQKAHYVKVRLC